MDRETKCYTTMRQSIKNVTVYNIYAVNIGTSKSIKQIVTELKGEISTISYYSNSNIVIVLNYSNS